MAKCHSFLWMSNILLCIHIPHLLFSYFHEDLGCFHILAIVNNASMNIGVSVPFQRSIFVFLGYILSSGITRSYCISIFRFFRKLHTVFHINLERKIQCCLCMPYMQQCFFLKKDSLIVKCIWTGRTINETYSLCCYASLSGVILIT